MKEQKKRMNAKFQFLPFSIRSLTNFFAHSVNQTFKRTFSQTWTCFCLAIQLWKLRWCTWFHCERLFELFHSCGFFEEWDSFSLSDQLFRFDGQDKRTFEAQLNQLKLSIKYNDEKKFMSLFRLDVEYATVFWWFISVSLLATDEGRFWTWIFVLAEDTLMSRVEQIWMWWSWYFGGKMSKKRTRKAFQQVSDKWEAEHQYNVNNKNGAYRNDIKWNVVWNLDTLWLNVQEEWTIMEGTLRFQCLVHLLSKNDIAQTVLDVRWTKTAKEKGSCWNDCVQRNWKRKKKAKKNVILISCVKQDWQTPFERNCWRLDYLWQLRWWQECLVPFLLSCKKNKQKNKKNSQNEIRSERKAGQNIHEETWRWWLWDNHQSNSASSNEKGNNEQNFQQVKKVNVGLEKDALKMAGWGDTNKLFVDWELRFAVKGFFWTIRERQSRNSTTATQETSRIIELWQELGDGWLEVQIRSWYFLRGKERSIVIQNVTEVGLALNDTHLLKKLCVI